MAKFNWNDIRVIGLHKDYRPYSKHKDLLYFAIDNGCIWLNGQCFSGMAIDPNSIEAMRRILRIDQLTNDKQVTFESKGQNNGVATLDDAGKIPINQLPSYVSDVAEYNTKTDFPTSGRSNLIYIAIDTSTTYRWSGSQYVPIGSTLTIGETEYTAYKGSDGAENRRRIITLETTLSQLTGDEWARLQQILNDFNTKFTQFETTRQQVETNTSDISDLKDIDAKNRLSLLEKQGTHPTFTYNKTDKKIYLDFLDKSNVSVLSAPLEISVDDFIKDGMVTNVSIQSNPNDEHIGKYLVINFNTDAGIDTIYLNVNDVFSPYTGGTGININNTVLSTNLSITGENNTVKLIGKDADNNDVTISTISTESPSYLPITIADNTIKLEASITSDNVGVVDIENTTLSTLLDSVYYGSNSVSLVNNEPVISFNNYKNSTVGTIYFTSTDGLTVGLDGQKIAIGVDGISANKVLVGNATLQDLLNAAHLNYTFNQNDFELTNNNVVSIKNVPFNLVTRTLGNGNTQTLEELASIVDAHPTYGIGLVVDTNNKLNVDLESSTNIVVRDIDNGQFASVIYRDINDNETIRMQIKTDDSIKFESNGTGINKALQLTVNADNKSLSQYVSDTKQTISNATPIAGNGIVITSVDNGKQVSIDTLTTAYTVSDDKQTLTSTVKDSNDNDIVTMQLQGSNGIEFNTNTASINPSALTINNKTLESIEQNVVYKNMVGDGLTIDNDKVKLDLPFNSVASTNEVTMSVNTNKEIECAIGTIDQSKVTVNNQTLQEYTTDNTNKVQEVYKNRILEVTVIDETKADLAEYVQSVTSSKIVFNRDVKNYLGTKLLYHWKLHFVQYNQDTFTLTKVNSGSVENCYYKVNNILYRSGMGSLYPIVNPDVIQFSEQLDTPLYTNVSTQTFSSSDCYYMYNGIRYNTITPSFSNAAIEINSDRNSGIDRFLVYPIKTATSIVSDVSTYQGQYDDTYVILQISTDNVTLRRLTNDSTVKITLTDEQLSTLKTDGTLQVACSQKPYKYAFQSNIQYTLNGMLFVNTDSGLQSINHTEEYTEIYNLELHNELPRDQYYIFTYKKIYNVPASTEQTENNLLQCVNGVPTWSDMSFNIKQFTGIYDQDLNLVIDDTNKIIVNSDIADNDILFNIQQQRFTYKNNRPVVNDNYNIGNFAKVGAVYALNSSIYQTVYEAGNTINIAKLVTEQSSTTSLISFDGFTNGTAYYDKNSTPITTQKGQVYYNSNEKQFVVITDIDANGIITTEILHYRYNSYNRQSDKYTIIADNLYVCENYYYRGLSDGTLSMLNINQNQIVIDSLGEGLVLNNGVLNIDWSKVQRSN